MEPLLIQNANLSEAWYKVLSHMVNNPGNDISPLVLSLTDFEEVTEIRESLDTDLSNNGFDKIQTVSETIFPSSLYRYCQEDRKQLYEQYLQNYKRIRKINPSNSRGTYFQRLINYEADGKSVNQLEIIINSILNGSVKRRSKLQASIFDPRKDHTSGMFLGFPCLQHITFYKSETGGLILNSFYAVQYVYRRSYGNWLGLINLGKFVAEETGLKFERFNCFIGAESLDNITKSKAKDLLDRINIAKLL